MSENDRLYPQKLAERRAKLTRSSGRSLGWHLSEIFETIRRCEATWALEERIEKGR